DAVSACTHAFAILRGSRASRTSHHTRLVVCACLGGSVRPKRADVLVLRRPERHAAAASTRCGAASDRDGAERAGISCRAWLLLLLGQPGLWPRAAGILRRGGAAPERRRR